MAINKIVLNTDSGEQVLVDLTGDTVNADSLVVGSVAHGADGEIVEGANPYALEATNTEVGTQTDLIAQIQTALEGKASPGGGITPSGTIQITENGSYDVANYAFAEVNVPSEEPNIQPLEVTENGTYTPSGDVDGYGPVMVNVASSGDDPRFEQLLTGTLPEMDDSSLATLRAYAFYGVTGLETARLTALTAVPVALFQNCSSLETVDLPQAAGRLGNNAFQNCSSLKNVNIPKITNFVNYAFSGCSSLEKLDLSENFVGFSGGAALNSCTKLNALILRRKNAIVTLGNSNNITGSAIASGTGYIYVPRALVDTYKAASNWSTYASQFRAIEDYPDITGG